MPLNPSYVGRTFGPAEPYEVSKAAVRQFADAIGDDLPIYRSTAAAQDAGYPDIPVPPTFAIVIASESPAHHPIFEAEFGMQYDRVVHGQQEFVHHRPLRIGDVITVTAEITEVTARGRNEMVTIETRLSDADGQPVCASINTLVSRGTAPTTEESR